MMRIAVVSDLHYSRTPSPDRPNGGLAHVLLLRAVKRFNRLIQPDLVLILGDCTEHPQGDEVLDELSELRDILDQLDCPWVIIPGNHDPAPDRFYQVMPRPGDIIDVGSVRILPFIDPEEPGWHARRTEANLARTRAARHDGFAGTVIAIQHVPAGPIEQMGLPLGYTNQAEVIDAMNAGGIDLALGGHCHAGSDLVQVGRVACQCVASLSDEPFAYTIVTIDDDQKIHTQRHALAMPRDFGLFDLHSHTPFAYCSENMDFHLSPTLAHQMGLRGLAMTEHSGQLYFPEAMYWRGDIADCGIAGARPEHARIDDYFHQAHAVSDDTLLVGLEVDADHHGNQVLPTDVAPRCQILLGAVHFLPVPRTDDVETAAVVAAFKQITERLCHTGIDVLAHPFRIFRRYQTDVPADVYPWLVKLLKRTGVAAEINFHTNEPHPAFVQQCIESGVKLTFGSDAHNLYEVGEFAPHLALLEAIGHTGSPRPLLLDPDTLKSKRPASPAHVSANRA